MDTPAQSATPLEGDGLRPSLAELVALRRSAHRAPPARRGRLGHAGSAPSPARGRGMEYAESRDYVPGDDARHIDWRVTARTGRAHTKLFQAERERLTLLVADTDPVLYFGTRVRFKLYRPRASARWQRGWRSARVTALRPCAAAARNRRSHRPVAPAACCACSMR